MNANVRVFVLRNFPPFVFFFLIGKIQIKTPATLVGSKRWLMFATRFRGTTQLLRLLMRSERENMDHKETVKFMHRFSGERELVLERQVPDMPKPSAALLCADRGRPASQPASHRRPSCTTKKEPKSSTALSIGGSEKDACIREFTLISS